MPETRTRRRRTWLVVLLVLVALAIGAVLALDAFLLSRARTYAAEYGQQLGREIRIGGLRTKLLGGLGVKVSDLAIGPGAGEDVPLLELRRAEVEADLLRAVRTGGKEISVDEAVLEGLRVNVVRFPDGTTNAERLAKRLEETQAKEPEAAPEPASEPADLSRIRVGRAAVENARIAFLDRATPGAKELAIDDLDVEVKDLAAGRPLLVTVRAAVLSAAQNFALDLRAPPLPPSLTPVPEELTLKVQPIDLAPLAPFVPASIGLRAGTFQADLVARLGGAVPGGEGPTKLAGGLAARALRFAGSEGGRALDVILDVDLDADAKQGELRIGKLRIEAGPVLVTGEGRATGLLGSSPRAEGLTVTGQGLDPAALAAYYPPLRELGRQYAGPASFTLKGSGTGEAAALDLRVELAPMRIAIPDAAAKPAGAPMSFAARAQAAGGGERVRFDASAELAGLDLRPGGAIAKAPGDPLSLKAAGTYRAAKDAHELELSKVELDLLGDRLTGAGKASVGTGEKPATRFDVSVSGDRLDLDRLLVAAPADAPAEEEPEEPADPAAFEGLAGNARLKLAKLRVKKLDFQDVVANVKVVEDEVTLEEARLGAFGGSLSAAGTRLKLAHPDEPFRIAAELKGVAMEQATALFSEHKVLAGRMNGKIDFTGKGMDAGALAASITGLVAGSLQDGTFFGKDLVASVAGPLAKALPFTGLKVTEGGKTSLGENLPFSFRIADGLASLEKPLQIAIPEANLTVNGGVKLDGTLQMPTTLALSPALVSRLTGGRAKPSEAIPVTFQLTGPAWKPTLAGLELQAAAKTIARDAASQAAGRALGLDGSVEDAAKAKQAEAEAAAKAKAQEVRQEAEAKATEEAERVRQKAEEEAKKKLRGILGR